MSYICASETFILHLLFGLLWFLNYIILWFNAAKLSIAATGKLTESNTCTNVTLVCPLCRDGADAIWKYSLWLRIHILNKSIIQLTFSNTRIYTILCQSIEWQVANCSTLFTQSWREDICTIPMIHSHCTSVKKLWAPKILVSFWGILLCEIYWSWGTLVFRYLLEHSHPYWICVAMRFHPENEEACPNFLKKAT